MRTARCLAPAVVVAAFVAIATACATPNLDTEPASKPAKHAEEDPEPTTAKRDPAVLDPVAPDASVADTSVAPRLCGEPDLLLCFSFEGEVKDGSPNAFAPTATQGVTFGPGKVGQAAQLSATSFIRFASAPLLTEPATTVEAWVNAAQRTDGVIFDADNRYAMATLADGSLRCIAQGADVRGGVVGLATWTHVACVYDGTEVRAYVNGVLINTGRGSTGHATAGAAIGGNAPNGEPFVGAIDSLRVFKVARTAAQIAAAGARN